jgi:Phage integrase, N-terminal SAM-like domain
MSESGLALVGVEKDPVWQRLKSLVLDSLSSVHSRRAYEQALDAFGLWYTNKGTAGFTKATVQAWRAALESAGLAASSINVGIAQRFLIMLSSTRCRAFLARRRGGTDLGDS